MVIEVNKDIDRYQESVAMGLTARQLIFSIASVVVGGGIVLLLRSGVVTGAAEHRERPDEREREHGGQHQAYLLLHVFLPLSGRIRAPPKGEGPQYIVLRSSSGLHESKPSMHRHIPFRCTDT